MNIGLIQRAWLVKTSARGKKPAPIRKLVVAATAHITDDKGDITINYDTIKGMTGLETRQVKDALHWMHKQKFLVPIPGVENPVGANKHKRYRLSFDGVPDMPQYVEPDVHTHPITGGHQPDYQSEFSAQQQQRREEYKALMEKAARSLPQEPQGDSLGAGAPIPESGQAMDESSAMDRYVRGHAHARDHELINNNYPENSDSTPTVGKDPTLIQDPTPFPITASSFQHGERTGAQAREAEIEEIPIQTPFNGHTLQLDETQMTAYRAAYPHLEDLHGTLHDYDRFVVEACAAGDAAMAPPSVDEWLAGADQRRQLEVEQRPEEVMARRYYDPSTVPSITTKGGKRVMAGVGDTRRILTGEIREEDWRQAVESSLDLESAAQVLDRLPDVMTS